jgi:hypothetical protein
MLFGDVMQKHVFVAEALEAVFTLIRPLISVRASHMSSQAKGSAEAFLAVGAGFSHITSCG